MKEHKCNLIQGLLEKSKLAQHAYREGHRICWKEAKALQIEPNTTYRKCKDDRRRLHAIRQCSGMLKCNIMNHEVFCSNFKI
jgi:hypothetical protein